MEEYLQPGKFVNSDHGEVIEFAHSAVGSVTDPKEQIKRLYYVIRDQIVYTPYVNFMDKNSYSAIGVLQTKRGFCIPKSALLVACARIVGVPARCGFADVANHLTSAKLRAAMGGANVFYWHSYSDIYLDGKWVKATPAFNKALCDRAGIAPLEFDGTCDSLFHEYDNAGNQHMEYLNDRGQFADVPFGQIVATLHESYGSTFFDHFKS